MNSDASEARSIAQAPEKSSCRPPLADWALGLLLPVLAVGANLWLHLHQWHRTFYGPTWELAAFFAVLLTASLALTVTRPRYRVMRLALVLGLCVFGFGLSFHYLDNSLGLVVRWKESDVLQGFSVDLPDNERQSHESDDMRIDSPWGACRFRARAVYLNSPTLELRGFRIATFKVAREPDNADKFLDWIAKDAVRWPNHAELRRTESTIDGLAALRISMKWNTGSSYVHSLIVVDGKRGCRLDFTSDAWHRSEDNAEVRFFFDSLIVR